MAMWKRFVIIAAGIVLCVCANARAVMVPISDYTLELGLLDLYCSYGSIPLTLDGTTYDTGPITLTFDPNYGPWENFLFFDFRDNSTREEWHCLVDFPLLHDLGIPPQKVFIVQTGGAGSITVAPSMLETEVWTEITVTYVIELSGTGTFEEGQAFSGWVYHNHGEPGDTTKREVKPPEDPALRKIWDDMRERERIINDPHEDSVVVSPDGTVTPLPADPTGGGSLKEIPEPATLSLLALGACLPLLRRRK